MAFRRTAAKLNREELKTYALRALGARALSSAELKARLRPRASDEADVDEVIARMREYGYLNDRRFAENFAGARRDSRGFGRQRVLADLLKKKVAPKVAESAVAGAYEGIDERRLVEEYLERKFRGKELGTLLREPNKLAAVYRRLRMAGFSSGGCIAVLKRHASGAERLEELDEPDSGG